MTNESVCVCVSTKFGHLHESIRKLCTFLLQATPIAFLPVGPKSYTPSHTHTVDLHAIFQPPRAKTMATKEWGIFYRPTNRQTEQLLELQAAVKHTTSIISKINSKKQKYSFCKKKFLISINMTAAFYRCIRLNF